MRGALESWHADEELFQKASGIRSEGFEYGDNIMLISWLNLILRVALIDQQKYKAPHKYLKAPALFEQRQKVLYK